MRRAIGLPDSLAVLFAVAAALALTASPQPAAATTAETGEPVETITSELEPGWNLAAWTEPAAPVETIFERIPEIQVVYSWDPDFQRFRLAMRADPNGHGDLQKLIPGMGLWLFVAGDEPVTWARPIIAEAAYAPLREGWNLVVWGGEDGVATRTALRDIDDILTTALDVNYRWPLELRTGEAYWLDVSGSREWNQVYQPLRIEFLADFSQQKQDEVRAHVDDVVEFFFQRLGFRVPGVIVQYGDPEQSGCSGYYQPPVIDTVPVINTADCLDVFAHEYVHAIQHHLGAFGAYPPSWFREGDANFWEAVYDDARGRRDYARHLREEVLPGARREGFVSRGLHSYHSYHIRVHVLVKREGPDALLQFYRRAAVLGDWQEAFEETYGMTVDEFNVVFAQEMLLAPADPSQACPADWYEPSKTRAGAPEQVCATIQGFVTDLAGNPRSGVEVGAVRGIMGDHDDGFREARQTTGPDGEFSFSVLQGSYSLSLLPVSLAPELWLQHHWYHSQRGLVLFHPLAGQVSATPHPEELVVAYGVIAGVIVSEDGSSVPGIHTGVIDSRGRGQSGPAPGAFQHFVGGETYVLEVNCAQGTRLGWYGGEEGFVRFRSQATPIVLEDSDITDLSITLPAGVSCE